MAEEIFNNGHHICIRFSDLTDINASQASLVQPTPDRHRRAIARSLTGWKPWNAAST
jgi:hypothetical protein